MILKKFFIHTICFSLIFQSCTFSMFRKTPIQWFKCCSIIKLKNVINDFSKQCNQEKPDHKNIEYNHSKQLDLLLKRAKELNTKEFHSLIQEALNQHENCEETKQGLQEIKDLITNPEEWLKKIQRLTK